MLLIMIKKLHVIIPSELVHGAEVRRMMVVNVKISKSPTAVDLWLDHDGFLP